MKRSFVFYVLIFFAFNSSIISQNFLPDKKLQNLAIKQKYELPQKALPLNLEPNPYLKSKSESFSKQIIGYTEYDIQSNRSIDQRIYLYDDKTIAAVWTMGTGNFSDRGTGYNYFDGKSWGKPPKSRIEKNFNAGWGSYSPFNNGEIVIAHDAVKNLIMSTREQKGTGDWEVTEIIAPDSTELTWPRVITVGDTIHILSASYIDYKNVKTPIIYSRSVDKGKTWTHRILPGMDYESGQLAYFPDIYAWASPKGGKLAFVVGNMWHDVFIMKSEDGGETWTKKIVFEHPKPFFFEKKEPLDTTFVPDGCLAIEFDNYGKLHVVFGVTRIAYTDTESKVYYTFPFSSYLAYWNEDFEPYKDLNNVPMILSKRGIAWLQDIDGDGKGFADFAASSQITTYGGIGLVSQPQITIDENNHIFVTFSHLNENLNTGAPKYQYYRHIWATKSEDGGNEWSYFTEISGGPLNEYGECVYASMSKTSDEYIHVIYQMDELPGLASADNPEHSQTNNTIFYTRVLKSDIGVTSDNIKKYNTINSLSIYPNPADDFVNIHVVSPFSYELNVNLRNILGQTIFSQKYNLKTGNNIITINTDNYQNGIYLLEIETNNYRECQKLIIER